LSKAADWAFAPLVEVVARQTAYLVPGLDHPESV